MSKIEADTKLVAYCGLYCGACNSYLKGRCPGCYENAKAGWCKVRACCVERHLSSCAACAEHPDPDTCSRFNNVISKFFGFIFRSDRRACVLQIRRLGLPGHAEDMARRGRQSLPRG